MVVVRVMEPPVLVRRDFEHGRRFVVEDGCGRWKLACKG